MEVCSDGQCILRMVSHRTKNISRKELESLWRTGKIVGLFNIPFDNLPLWMACNDFAIEGEDEQELIKRNENLKELNQKLLKKIAELKEEISSLQSKLLIVQEEFSNAKFENSKYIEFEKKKVTEISKKLGEQNEKWKREKRDLELRFQSMLKEKEKIIKTMAN